MALDPEQLLWVPGAKTISIPKPPAMRSAWEANAEAIAAQLEATRRNLPSLFLSSDLFFKKFTSPHRISQRPSRIVLRHV